MAREVIINMRGKFKNVIFYKRGDKYYGKSVPARVRQSRQTKINSGRFGTAVSVSKSLRHAWRSLLPNPKARDTMYRLNNAVYQWLLKDPDLKRLGLQPVHNLKTLSLNGDYGFYSTRHVDCVVDWANDDSIKISIPAVNPVKTMKEVPPGAASITLQMAVVSCRLSNAVVMENKYSSFEFPYSDEELAAQEITVPFTKTPGSLIIVAGFLQYQLKENATIKGKNPLQWMPAGIVDAVYVG